jgi:hypothetical protein
VASVEGDQPAGDREGTEHVDPAPAQVGTLLGDPAQRGQGHGQPDGHVDQEDPVPAEELGEDAAGQHADRAAGPEHGPPDPEGPVALGALRERGGDDGQGGRRDHGAAESLDGPGHDEHRLVGGQAAGQRGQREQPEPGQQHAALAEQVGGPATQELEAGERDRVGAHHPLQVLLAEAEVGLDRRQGHVHDRDVEDDHELGRAGHGQHEAGTDGRPQGVYGSSQRLARSGAAIHGE